VPFNYQTPGVYVEEVASGARPIEAAATAILAVVGLCREQIHSMVQADVPDPATGGTKKDLVIQLVDTPKTPTLVTSWSEFMNTYGGVREAFPGGFLHDTMYGYFNNGGRKAYVVGIPLPTEDRSEPAAAGPALPRGEGVLNNAAGRQTLRLIGQGLKSGERITVEVTAPEPGSAEGTFTLVVKRDGEDPRTIPNLTYSKGAKLRNVVETLAKESPVLTAEIIDAPGSVAERMPLVGGSATITATVPTPPAPTPKTNGAVGLKQKLSSDLFLGNVDDRTGIAGLETVDDVTLVACPDIVAVTPDGRPATTTNDVKAVQRAILDHCEAMKDRFAILDCPAGLNVQQARDWRMNGIGFDSAYASLYYPWVKVGDKFVPPSGLVAGVYARVDEERGVFKAPANEVVRGVIDLERNVTRNQQELLNPIGINCIRSFPGQGIRIWGARTLSNSDAQWRYVPVRRLFCNIEESILQATSWIVFEPNNERLWVKIKRDITAFLTVQWRAGALFGATPEQAFFVKCDEETNPVEVRDLGYCVVEVGLAPVKPAEFVVFRVRQVRDAASGAAEL
jgi:phage tail sheath protein FI